MLSHCNEIVLELLHVFVFKMKQPTAVKQRIAKLEKFKRRVRITRQEKPPFLGKPFNFCFPDAPRLSPEVVVIKNLFHAYTETEESENKLFEDTLTSWLIRRATVLLSLDRTAGSGKSALLPNHARPTGRNQMKEGAEIVGQ